MALPRERRRPFWFGFILKPAGAAVLALGLFILVRGLAFRNAYEIVPAAAALGLLLILRIAGAWGARRLELLEPGWKPPVPLGAGDTGETLVTGLDAPVPWFFRLHFIVRGRFFPAASGRGCPVFAETSAPRGGAAARLGLGFPMSGVFRGEGQCRLRDIFGFFTFPCGLPQHRMLQVHAAPCPPKPLRIEARSGAEDRRNKSASDEERYYMREYSPGDRLRDINWKSSERIDTLITRISPDTQEKVNRLEVDFRNYGPGGGASPCTLEELWLLDRAKARLGRFLRSVKEEDSSYVFRVRAAQGEWDIEDQDGLEAFLEELAGLPFSPSRYEDSGAEPEAKGDLYVFSTACDTGLLAFLAARRSRPVFLFFTRPPASGIPAGEAETVRLRAFTAKGIVPSPRWLLRIPSGRNMILNPPRNPDGRIEIEYAEARW
jgi:hypothetical protein